MQLSLFNSLVNSILCYACELWGFAEAKAIETLHLKYLKQILKVKKNTPNCIIYRECNVYPLYITRIIRILNFWLKLLNLDDNNPLKMSYIISTGLYNANHINKNTPYSWAFRVKYILYSNGFGYVWENQKNGVNKHFIYTFKKRLIDSFWQSNNADIDALSQNRLYRHLTLESCFYLKALPNNFVRIAITRLRLGSHHLNIERGRWTNTVLAQRKCTLCDDLEDEYHFVVTCVKFQYLRIKYLPKHLYTNPSMYKFLNFVNTENKSQLRKLGLFLHHAFIKYTNDEVLN